MIHGRDDLCAWRRAIARRRRRPLLNDSSLSDADGLVYLTAAGFVLIRLRQVLGRRLHLSIFAVVSIALIVSGGFGGGAVCAFARRLAAQACRKRRWEESRAGSWRHFRSLLPTAMPAIARSTIAVTLGFFIASPLAAAAGAAPSSSRRRHRPELVVDLTLPQNGFLHLRQRPRGGQARTRCSRTIPTSPAGAPMSGVARSCFDLPLNVQFANDFFAQAVVIAGKDVSARERLHAALEKKLAEVFRGVVSRVSPLKLGRRSGAGAIRVSGPTSAEVRAISCNSALFSVGRQSAPGEFRLDGSPPERFVSRSTRTRPVCSASSSQALSAYLNTVMTGPLDLPRRATDTISWIS